MQPIDLKNRFILTAPQPVSLERRVLRAILPLEEAESVEAKGGSIIESLLMMPNVSQHDFYQGLAKACGAKFSPNFPQGCFPLLKPAEWRQGLATHSVPIKNELGDLCYWHAPQGINIARFIENCERNAHFAKAFIITPPFGFTLFLRRYARDEWSAGAISTLKTHAPKFSASSEVKLKRFAIGLTSILILFMVGCFLFKPFALVAGGGFGLLFFSLLVLRLCFGFIKHPPPPSIALDLPRYSVVLALYKEAEVIPSLLKALEAIDYPKNKLDVKLVLEADDGATFHAIREVKTSLKLDIIIAPSKGPRTKPKALMLALPYATGEFLVVYDAEDQPHPLQLREAAGVFAAGSSRLAVLQAPLVIRNASETLLTRFFSADYASLFDVILPALTHYHLPLPLGGTSNHFRVSHLRKTGGWDPYNVTEDADLGLRLARFGFEAGVLTCGTTEEAPETFDIWLKQRTRWFKGWLQTLYVHFSHPRDLVLDLGFKKAITIFLLLGGSFASALLHPFGVLIALYYQSVFALSILAVGYLFGAIVLLQGVRRRARQPIGLTLLLLPVWWLLLSLAAWRAVKELYLRPFHWAKTPHKGT
jgi:glycosyltransferase XagB